MNPHAAAFAAFMQSKRVSAPSHSSASTQPAPPSGPPLSSPAPPLCRPSQPIQPNPYSAGYAPPLPQQQQLFYPYNCSAPTPTYGSQLFSAPVAYAYPPAYSQQQFYTQPPIYNPQQHQRALTAHMPAPRQRQQQPYRSNETKPSQQVIYCEPCDKEFRVRSAYDTHLATHERCSHPGCVFSASKKAVSVHHHGTHGEFSGTGYKTIEVEGQKFRVLMGSDADEISQWRKERKSRFPTASNVTRRLGDEALLAEAGGIRADGASSSWNKKTAVAKRGREGRGDGANDEGGEEGKLRRVGEDGETTVSGESGADKRASFPCKYNYKGRICSKGEACPYSHTEAALLCTRFSATGRCIKGFKCMFVHDKDTVKGKGTKGASAASHSKGASTTTTSDRANVKKGELFLPDPSKGSLLARLAARDALEEDNVLLQCLHFLRSKSYLQE